MPDFDLQIFERATQSLVRERVSADSVAAAQAAVLSRGRVLSCEPVGTKQATDPAVAKSAGVGSSKARLDVAWWCRELRTLLNAGMTVVEALATMKTQAQGAERQRVHEGLLTCLQQGLSLSSAMSEVKAFPPILVSSVKASERTSTLTQALEDYLKYHELLDGLKKKVISAAIYPGLVATLGAAISVFLLMFVLPRFAGMYAAGTGASGTTAKLLVVSAWMRSHTLQVCLGAIAAAVTLAWAWREGHVRKAFAVLADRTPALQNRIDEFRLAKLYQALALMVRGGYTLAEALLLAANLELGRDFESRLLGAHEELTRGRSVSAVLAQAKLTDEVTQRLVQVGERTGNFDVILTTLAQRHGERFTLFVERTTRIVEPLLLLAVSLVVGSLVVLMYMPVFDIANSIQ